MTVGYRFPPGPPSEVDLGDPPSEVDLGRLGKNGKGGENDGK